MVDFSSRCTVHLELKSTMNNDPDFVPRVLEVLRQPAIVDQVILVSFNHALLRPAKQLLPELRVGALVYGCLLYTSGLLRQHF